MTKRSCNWQYEQRREVCVLRGIVGGTDRGRLSFAGRVDHQASEGEWGWNSVRKFIDNWRSVQRVERVAVFSKGSLSLCLCIFLSHSFSPLAQIDGVTDEKFTYADVLERSVRLANRFHRLGIKKDTVVAVMCENRIELPIVSFAATYLRAIPILLNPGYTATELAHVLKYSQPRAIFASPLAMATLQPLLRTVPSIKLTVLFGDKKPHPKVTHYCEHYKANSKSWNEDQCDEVPAGRRCNSTGRQCMK